MERAKESIRQTLDEAKQFRERNPTSRISEADTKAHFIDPIIFALGWRGFGTVTREYYIPSSQQFIDYVMAGETGPLLAIEAKPFYSDLGEKEAAQLVMYCTVAGIEWAALTNGRQLQFFNAFLKSDLSAKRVIHLDLLDYSNDDEFDAIFRVLSLLSRESMTTPTGLRRWLTQIQLDRVIRNELANAESGTVKQLLTATKEAEVVVSSEDIVRWIESHLLPTNKMIPRPRPFQPLPVESRPHAPSATPIPVEHSSRPLVQRHQPYARNYVRPKARYRATLRDLLVGGLLRTGERLVLLRGGVPAANATLSADGSIEWEGRSYPTPSDMAFARILGRQSLNGWTEWYVDRPQGRVSLASIRSQYLSESASDSGPRASGN